MESEIIIQQTASSQILTANRSRSTGVTQADKDDYSAPGSPATTSIIETITPPASPADNSTTIYADNVKSNVIVAPNTTSNNTNTNLQSQLSTPKKNFLDAVMLKTIREKLATPGGACELRSMRLESNSEPVKVIKQRYLITPQVQQGILPAKSMNSYRQFVDLTSSNLKCTDIYTAEQFLCKIINEPLDKVQRAYFNLKLEADYCCSSIYGHPLIRAVHDIAPLSKQKTYIILEMPKESEQLLMSSGGGDADAVDYESDEEEYGIYEDLHTYVRNKRRLCETEARALFHQISETVRVCHRNGIILRDLKLKRFYFIDKARTKLQYESLEGSMILEDHSNDTLTDKIGCPLYTAPELLCPNPTYRGKPADIWSLGVILYTMLVGQYPFYEKANCNLITIIRHCHVQIPSSLSRPVRWLLLSLLRKNYTERIEIQYVFFAPWVKQQTPYYMHVPVDIELSDDEMSVEEEQNQKYVEQAQQQLEADDEEAAVEGKEYGEQSTQTRQHLEMMRMDTSSSSSNAVVSAINCTEPLDYTHTALSSHMHCDDLESENVDMV